VNFGVSCEVHGCLCRLNLGNLITWQVLLCHSRMESIIRNRRSQVRCDGYFFKRNCLCAVRFVTYTEGIALLTKMLSKPSF
jgi:hypothetical protein